jgi:hypothetical protein
MPAHKVKQPVIDTPVATIDGEQFGYVKDLHGSYFKIDVPMARDFWLAQEYIASSTLDVVTLSLRKDELDEHRLAEPGLEDPVGEGMLSSAEMLTQREHMERELEMQREKMRSGLV